MKQKVMVAGRNSDGSADMFACSVEVSEEQFNLGVHYDAAESLALEAGFEPPFVCFDEHEQVNIANHVSKLDCPITFELEDKSENGGDSTQGAILFGWDGVSIQLDGYSDYSSTDNNGIVAFLDRWDGSVNLRAYADINIEEPTDLICLDGAQNTNRTQDVEIA